MKEEIGGSEGWEGWPLGAPCICMDECFMDELLCNLCVSEPPVRLHSLCRQHFFPFRTPGFALTLEIYALYILPCQSPCAGRAAQPSLKRCRIKRFILQMWGNRRGDGYPVKLSQVSRFCSETVHERHSSFYVTTPVTFSFKSPTLCDIFSFSIFFI